MSEATPEDQHLYQFSVNDTVFSTSESALSGVAIRMIANVGRGYQIYEARPDNEPDRLLSDNTLLELRHDELVRLFAVPPALFGNSPLQKQMGALKMTHPEARMEPQPSGEAIIVIPSFQLRFGWSHSHTTILFVAPVGYPFARPDGFWTSFNLRLRSGGLPIATASRPLPGTQDLALWFSWHIEQWNPNTDTLTSYLHTIKQRLDRLE